MAQKFQKMISIWIYLVIKSMVLPNQSFDVFHQILNQKLHKNGFEVREKFFLVSFLASESWCFEISWRTTINLEIFCCSNSIFLINEDLVFSIRKGSRKFSLLWEYTGEVIDFSVCVGFPMVPKFLRTLFASKLLLVHTFFLRYCILYFSNEIVIECFFRCGENINPKKNRFCCLRRNFDWSEFPTKSWIFSHFFIIPPHSSRSSPTQNPASKSRSR